MDFGAGTKVPREITSFYFLPGDLLFSRRWKFKTSKWPGFPWGAKKHRDLRQPKTPQWFANVEDVREVAGRGSSIPATNKFAEIQFWHPKIPRTSASTKIRGSYDGTMRRNSPKWSWRKIMFSIFEYFRRRTCDSILAGAYDAAEILEQEPVEELADKPDDKTLSPVNAPAPATPPTPPQSPKKIGSLPSPPPSAAGDLFSQAPPTNSTPALPPRKRGRPPKNPPQPPSQP